MKRITTLVFAIILSTSLNAQWQQTNGPCGGNISSLATIGNNVFVGTYCGVYFSSNNGSSWIVADSGLTNYSIFSMATSGTNIFAGTAGGGIFLSTNSSIRNKCFCRNWRRRSVC